MFLKTILSLNCLFPKKCNTISKELVRYDKRFKDTIKFLWFFYHYINTSDVLIDQFASFVFRLKASSGSEKNSDVIFLVGEEPDIQRIPAHRYLMMNHKKFKTFLAVQPWLHFIWCILRLEYSIFSWILIKGSPVFRAMFRGPLSPVNSVNKSDNKEASRFNISKVKCNNWLRLMRL